jgi:hypothetical protein
VLIPDHHPGFASWERKGRVLLAEATLEGTDLTRAGLRRADLSKATLAWPTLEATELREARLDGVQVYETARFQGVDLREAWLLGARLGAASLDDVRLKGAWYNRETEWPHTWSGPPPGVQNAGEWWLPGTQTT